MPLLATRQLTKLFGGLAAVNQVDLTVEPGAIVGLIGPNGAGKTTCFNLLSGFLRPTTGSITFDGEDITGWRPHRITARGLVRTFQHTTLFHDMTALENVLLGLTRPVNARRLVVLPAPFAPIRLTIEPADTENDTPFTASTAP